MNLKLQLLELLSKHNLAKILQTLPTLSAKEKINLFKQIEIIKNHQIKDSFQKLAPLEKCINVSSKNYRSIGLNSIKKQKVACMIFAAGEGSRFNFKRAKGLFCIKKNTSLFAYFCRWILAYEIAFNIKIPLLFLVSTKNKNEIKEHFEKNFFFNLDPNQISFIEQDNYPFFNEKGELILNHNGQILTAPNGNGGFFEAFQKNDVITSLKKQKIDYLQVLFIDNPLIDPIDPSLLGFLIDQDVNVAIHVFERDNPNEKVGVICKTKNNEFVVDYTQIISADFKKFKGSRLYFPYANSGHFCISVDSLSNLMDKKISLPYHWVWKKINEHIYGWKAEKFAFDIFPFLSCKSLCYDKKLTFAPLKTLEDVKNSCYLLNQKNQKIYQKVYGKNGSRNLDLKITDIVNFLRKEEP